MPGDQSSPNQNKEEIIESQILLWPWRIFFLKAFLFSLTLGLGIVTAFKLNKFLRVQEIPLEPIPFWHFLFYFLLATFFIISLSFLKEKFQKGKNLIFKIIFILVVLWGGLISLSLWLPPKLSFLSFFLILGLIFWWLKKPLVLTHNLAIIFGISGIGGVLGLQILPWAVVSFLILFSIYDYIAVYKTKHMIKMAKEMIEAGAILALIIPQKISDFLTNLAEVKPGGKFLILGGGDVAFPLLLAASLIPAGILNSLIVAFFALIGLFASFYFFISQKFRKPIPALPPIAFFSIIGFLITLLVF